MSLNATSRRKEADIRPILQFSVTCDRYVPTPSGKPNFEEVFSHFLTTGRQRFFVVNRFTNGLGVHKQRLRFYKPNATDSIDGPEMKFTLENRAIPHDLAAAIDFNFSEPGVWWLEIILDDKPTLSYPLSVYG